MYIVSEILRLFVVSIILSVLATIISILSYKYGSKKWHFVIGKQSVEFLFTIVRFTPMLLIIEIFDQTEYVWWIFGAYVILLFCNMKKIIAIEESIIDRLKRLNKNYQN